MTFNDNKASMLTPLLLIILAVSVVRAYFLSISSVDLYVDEIQYWWWSKDLDWGYYSKPPMIAVLISLVTGLFGDSVYTIKLGGILVYPLTSYMIYLLGRRLISEQVGFWAAVLFITLPGVAFSSTITSTDVLLFLFWSSAMLFFIRSIDSNAWSDWLICAVICGLGLLTKYNMAVFSLSALGYMLFFGHQKQLLNPKLWVMAVIALTILAPNFYWNYQHDFPTFSHTAGYVEHSGLRPDKMISFLFEQAGIIGPVGFVVMWWWIIRGEHPRNLLLTFSLPMLIIISLVALQGKYNSNWAAPAYVGIIIGVAHFLQNRKKWRLTMLVTNLLLGLVVGLADPVIQATGTTLQAKHDPFKRVRGWKTWGEQVKTYLNQYPDRLLIAEGREEITEAMFYALEGNDKHLKAWSPSRHITSHFQLTRPYTGEEQEALVLTGELDDNYWRRYFSDVEVLTILTRQVSIDRKYQYKIYKVSGFRGYD